ncbi:MAG: hypothetical protein BAJALOKI1v1_2530005 [Promethearchaeota archaeon]|nr:MAG: hypothetical protein BAJALOKI1v1_2530005 [Candidatus Lokiarchaeota archaeon]
MAWHIFWLIFCISFFVINTTNGLGQLRIYRRYGNIGDRTLAIIGIFCGIVCGLIGVLHAYMIFR